MSITRSFMLVFSLGVGGCGAVTAPSPQFPYDVTITSGNTLDYKSGDVSRHWEKGDTVTFDFLEGTLYLDGLVHFPHPRLMKDESALEEQYGRVPYVVEHFDSTKAWPWNAVVMEFEDALQAVTRAAEEAYVASHDAEAARAILVDSWLFTNVEITEEIGCLALKYHYKGLGGPVYLELRDSIAPAARPPAPLSYERACRMARHIEALVTSTDVHHEVHLIEGNEAVHGTLPEGK